MINVFCLIVVLLMGSPVFAAQAKAVIKGTSPDSQIVGEAILNQEQGGLTINISLKNVPGAGQHGIHFHEYGSCEDGGKEAGGHFNPNNTEHGYFPKAGSKLAHAGDMGNIDVAQDGSAALFVFMPGLMLEDENNALIGKSIILHEKADDFSQPTGNAGGRIACGIIEKFIVIADENETESNQE